MTNNKYIYPVIFALIHFALTTICGIDRVFFDYPNILYPSMIFIKMLYCLFLILGYTFIFNVVEKIKEKNELYIRGAKLFFIYFFIILILILLVWPGMWSWSDVWVLSRDLSYKYQPWQHVITSVKDLLFLQLLPFAGGIIIVQNAIIALCVAFSIIKFENTYNIFLKNKLLDYIFKLLPFLMFPVLRYQLSGYRMGGYVYLEVTMLVILICAIKNKEFWTYKYSALFIFLTIICTVWRTESLLYMPVIILLLLFMKHIGSLKKRLAIIFLIIVGVFGINTIQKYSLKNSNYEIISTVMQCTELIRHADKEKDKDLLADIDKITDIQVALDNPEKDGEELYWYNNYVRENYTKSDYKNYLKAFVKLSIKYPKVVLNERVNIFLNTNKDINKSNIEYILSVLSNDENKNKASVFFVSLGNKFFLNKPINEQVRRKTAQIITLNNHKFLYKIIWNIIPPILILLFSWIILLYKKYWKEFFVASSVIGKLFIVILTVPAAWFMYYLSFYMIGYLVLFYWIMYILTTRRVNQNA